MKNFDSIHIKCGNSVELLKTLESESVDLIVTDPPYKVVTGGDVDSKDSLRPKGILTTNKQLMVSIPKFEDWMFECYRVLKENTHAYFMINTLNLLEISLVIQQVGFKIHNFLIWEKNNCTPSQFYMKNCEYIIFCRKGKSKYIHNIGNSKTVHKFDNVIGNKSHPTEKPIELMKFYIENSSNEGDTILDPFMGGGSTGIACVETKRNFIGFEIVDNYFEIAKKRIEDKQKELKNKLIIKNAPLWE